MIKAITDKDLLIQVLTGLLVKGSAMDVVSTDKDASKALLMIGARRGGQQRQAKDALHGRQICCHVVALGTAPRAPPWGKGAEAQCRASLRASTGAQ